MKHKKIGLKESLGTDENFMKFLVQEAKKSRKNAEKEVYAATVGNVRKKGHPTPQMLYDYVMGLLEKKDAMKIQKHFSFCGVCADESLRIMRIEDELTAKSVDWANKILWRTFPWEPLWAGVPATASEIPEQRHSFKIDEGEINLSCYWKPKFGNDPAYIHLSWNAKITISANISARLWVRFVNSETQKVFSEICLGNRLQGEDNVTSEKLNFDPSNEKWAVSIIFEETE